MFQCPSHGLTFVELLIAVTMVAILFVGLAGHLRGGITVWERVTQFTEAHQQERAALDRMSRDLANALVLDERPEAYAPPTERSLKPAALTSSTLEFYTTASRRANELAPVTFVSYACRTIGERPGLWRSSWSIAQSRAKRGPEPELVLADCERLSFRYAYLRSDEPDRQAEPLDWRTTWQETPKALPRLVGVELVVSEPIKRRGAVTTVARTLRTVVMIPSGVLRSPAPPP